MGGVLHGCARTTPRLRAGLQASQTSTRAFVRRYGLDPKTVAKWRARTTTADAPTGPRRRSTVLAEAEEAAVVEFRRRTLLPLDDLQYSLGEGPCVETLRAADIVVAPHIRHDQRWPRFVPAAVEMGLRSQLAVRLYLDGEGTLGGINLYSTISDEPS